MTMSNRGKDKPTPDELISKLTDTVKRSGNLLPIFVEITTHFHGIQEMWDTVDNPTELMRLISSVDPTCKTLTLAFHAMARPLVEYVRDIPEIVSLFDVLGAYGAGAISQDNLLSTQGTSSDKLESVLKKLDWSNKNKRRSSAVRIIYLTAKYGADPFDAEEIAQWMEWNDASLDPLRIRRDLANTLRSVVPSPPSIQTLLQRSD